MSTKEFVTHYLNDDPPSGLSWQEEADFFFARPALCGARNWDAASDKPKGVTCPKCRAALKQRAQ
jgi:hypothetical protein